MAAMCPCNHLRSVAVTYRVLPYAATMQSVHLPCLWALSLVVPWCPLLWSITNPQWHTTAPFWFMHHTAGIAPGIIAAAVVVPVVVLAALAALATWALRRTKRRRAAQRRAAAAGLAPAGADKDVGPGGDGLDIEAGLDQGPRGGGSSVAVSVACVVVGVISGRPGALEEVLCCAECIIPVCVSLVHRRAPLLPSRSASSPAPVASCPCCPTLPGELHTRHATGSRRRLHHGRVCPDQQQHHQQCGTLPGAWLLGAGAPWVEATLWWALG
jgi:hypothetical protein